MCCCGEPAHAQDGNRVGLTHTHTPPQPNQQQVGMSRTTRHSTWRLRTSVGLMAQPTAYGAGSPCVPRSNRGAGNTERILNPSHPIFEWAEGDSVNP